MKPKKITPKTMLKKWEEYKQYCDNKAFIVNEFSQKISDFVTKKLVKPITYTIMGFCHEGLNMTFQNFYATYHKDPEFEDVITRIKEECEMDAREKFEAGLLNPKLSGMWMSKYGYSVNKEEKIEVNTPIRIVDDLGD